MLHHIVVPFYIKDKKLDELTKQVIRFKRIQEIVLSAQAPIKSKSKPTLVNKHV